MHCQWADRLSREAFGSRAPRRCALPDASVLRRSGGVRRWTPWRRRSTRPARRTPAGAPLRTPARPRARGRARWRRRRRLGAGRRRCAAGAARRVGPGLRGRGRRGRRAGARAARAPQAAAGLGTRHGSGAAVGLRWRRLLPHGRPRREARREARAHVVAVRPARQLRGGAGRAAPQRELLQLCVHAWRPRVAAAQRRQRRRAALQQPGGAAGPPPCALRVCQGIG